MSSEPSVEQLRQVLEGLCQLHAWQGELLGRAKELLDGRPIEGGISPRVGRSIQRRNSHRSKKE